LTYSKAYVSTPPMSGGNSGLMMATRMNQSINVILHAPACETGIVACDVHFSVALARSRSHIEHAARSIFNAPIGLEW
jgi:hypothetical protein